MANGRSKRALFLALTLGLGALLSIGVLEVGLRVLTDHPLPQEPTRVRDDVLGYRMNPAFAEIDARGFRNVQALDRANIVTIGDSHTYGFNVDDSDSWPSLLAASTGKSVYNMGVGGYGSVQYKTLIERALAMKPERIILGFYPANDFDDVCKSLPHAAGFEAWAEQQGLNVGDCGPPAAPVALGHPPRTGLGAALKWGTALGSAVIATLWRPFRAWLTRTRDAWHQRHPVVVVARGATETVIKHSRIERHLGMMDPLRPATAFGVQFTTAMLREAAIAAGARGVRLDVLLIPSKEWVFYLAAQSGDVRLPETYGRLVKAEAKHSANLLALCKSLGLRCVSALAEVRSALAETEAVYGADDDGHPLEPGYRAYARAAGALADPSVLQQAL